MRYGPQAGECYQLESRWMKAVHPSGINLVL